MSLSASIPLRRVPHSFSSLSRRLKHSTRTHATEARLPQCTHRDSPSLPAFPCVDAHTQRELSWIQSSSTSTDSSDTSSGPEPPYARPAPSSYSLFHSNESLPLTYGSSLPSFDIAYETWGTLNIDKSNAILLHTGLSASSHAASTSTNPSPGWWQNFIGPAKAIDTNKYFVICTNVLGGCYGSTGPSSPIPSSSSPQQQYATHFPVISIFDMVRAQFRLLDFLGIQKLYASVGSSMGAMQSLACGWMDSDRVGRIVSISGTARSSPSSIAMRFAQRSVLMADPNWNKGFYYDSIPPHTGMKLARQIATITYRSGPEWDQRFGRQLRPLPPSEQDTSSIRVPALCPDFLIETYLDHQGEQFCLKYDANSFIYISKAMDLFDMTHSALTALNLVPSSSSPSITPQTNPPTTAQTLTPHRSPPYLTDLANGLTPLAHTPTLVLGVQSDILFPVEQQREVADALRMAGNANVSYYELGGVWGHDTFLLDVRNVGGAIKGFLDSA